MHFRDTIRFLSKLSFAKVANMLGLMISFYLSKWTRVRSHSFFPMTISIEPTTACNLRCPECPSGLRSFTRPTGNLKKDFFRQVIAEVKDKLIYLIFYFQGEPYINPDFLKMVKHASDQGIYTITSTNGHFLSDDIAKKTIESGLDRLIISIDGTSQDTYQHYRRGGSLDNVLAGAKNMVKWKKKLKSHSPHIIFQFLVVRPNEHQIDEVNELAKEIGVDEVKFKSAQIYDYKKGNPLIPQNQKYSRYKKKADGTYGLKHELNNACWKMWHSAVITWDGKVVPCCFDKDADHVMGTITEEVSLKSILQDENYSEFKNAVFSDRSSVDICQNCTEGCQVWH